MIDTTDPTLDAPSAPALDVGDDPFPGEFRLLERLGGGAFGTVHKALDLSPLGRLVALKFLSSRIGHAATLAALRNEARLLAALEHPNLVRVHAWKQSGEMPCLVLQFVAGGSLAGVLSREGPLSWQRAARYVADVANGLELMHARGVFHRDIKPDNILLDTARDEAVLTDLGIAARLEEGASSAGTIPYMPPEAFDRHLGPSHDVFSLAATLFVLVTGQLPFGATDPIGHLAAVRDGLPELDARLAIVPAALERLLREGLAGEMSRRPGLSAFSQRLRGALNGLLADCLVVPGTSGLRLVVSRQDGGAFVPVAATLASTAGATRDMQKVPACPERVRLRTGDRVRIELESAEAGSATVFNVGPTGNLNLLGESCPVRPGHPLHILDVEMTPPAGTERVFAVWTRGPMPLRVEDLRALAEQGAAYRATRDMAKVKKSLDALPPSEHRTTVLEVEHSEGAA